jgi:hypothetical protein
MMYINRLTNDVLYFKCSSTFLMNLSESLLSLFRDLVLIRYMLKFSCVVMKEIL